VEPDHRPSGDGVEQAGRAQLDPADPAPPGMLLGPVGHVDQAGHDRHAADGGRHPAGQVGLEQGGVDQVGPPVADEPLRPPGPAGSSAPAGQRVQTGPGGGQLGLDAGALVQGRDLEHDAAGHQVGGHGGQGALGAAGHQAVDQVEHAHRVAPGSGG
jgi:hypothetical protein